MVDYPIHISGDPQPGDTHMINIGPIADKLSRLSLIVDVPTPEVKMKEPIVDTIKEIIDKYGFVNVFNHFPQPKKGTDTVIYDELFNNSPTSLGSQMIDRAKVLNKLYNSQLDILDYY